MNISKLPKLAILAASLFTTISVVAQQRAADAPARSPQRTTRVLKS